MQSPVQVHKMFNKSTKINAIFLAGETRGVGRKNVFLEIFSFSVGKLMGREQVSINA